MTINGVTNLAPETAHRLALFSRRLIGAREERGWTLDRITRIADLDAATVLAAENGDPTIPIGAYLAILWALDLDSDVDNLAAPRTALPNNSIDTNF
jgi:transcriptional regulator with XRE-family HTH domain